MNAMTLTANFRRFELPWAPLPELERRFKRTMRTALFIFVVGSALILLLPRVDRPRRTPADLPERVVQLIVEQPIPPPPPPPVPEKEKPKPTVQQPSPVPSNVRTPEDVQQKVRKTGMLALQDELADLRDKIELDQPKPEDTNTGPDVRSERSLITSAVGSASSGINTAAMSRGFGGGAGAIGTHTTTRVPPPSSVIGNGRGSDGVRRSGASGKPSRSREEIETVFDRNKGALYALYTRAQRDNAELQGKLVLELTIAPSGEVTACRVVSSELKDAELERKIVARVKLFKFEARDVEPITANKPIDFFPA
jgi:TonB family protein